MSHGVSCRVLHTEGVQQGELDAQISYSPPDSWSDDEPGAIKPTGAKPPGQPAGLPSQGMVPQQARGDVGWGDAAAVEHLGLAVGRILSSERLE